MSPLLLDGSGTVAQGTSAGVGVAELTSTATSGQYAMARGDFAALALAGAVGYWFRAELTPRSVSSAFVEAGLCDSDRTDYVRFLFDTSVDATYWRFESRDNTTQNALTLPHAAAADTFVTLDIVFVTTIFAAGWLNGDGPYTLTANLPSASLTPYVLSGTRTSAAKTVRLESVRLDALNGTIINPAVDPMLRLYG